MKKTLPQYYYQPVLKDEEWGDLLFSFQVYYDKQKAQDDFPGREIATYSFDDIEDPTFVDKMVVMNRIKYTFYEAWNQGLSGYTSQGSFCTRLLEAYRVADADNMQKLEQAFPEWFVKIVLEK